MSNEIGSQSQFDYPYKASDGNCRKQRGKKIKSRASSFDFVEFTGGDALNIQAIKDRLNNGPMTVYVAAGNVCWRFYKFGVINSNSICVKLATWNQEKWD